ncbi:hypothetical protein SLH49_17625 [Cognatiyoonia sp. IB215446]|uniref:hypothetical protein n=1 Tax=Cognatiyoonia sp. IB215446 TaxID=3097355 RepID=UPI002A0EFEC3|nr:hypothetical protein [Cognatiyoonia sp. IB215446]MDX8349809.1 hypothetical protein [Cognatiyoonia sp. IB215446]
MSFASAFLGLRENDTTEKRIAATVESVLQSISPECDVPDGLQNVRSSNLCYGVPMQWALGDGAQSKRTRGVLRERLTTFEPRLNTLSEIDVVENDQENSVTFVVVGTSQVGSDTEAVDIEKRLSRMDQHVDNGG